MSSYISSKRSYQLLQPNSIGVLSSIAIHTLILGIVLPNINIFGARSNSGDSRTVKITQLHERELIRLPNFNRNPIALTNPIKPKFRQPKSLTSIYPDLNQLESKIIKQSNLNSQSRLNYIKLSPLPIPIAPQNKIPPPPPVIPAVKSLNQPRSISASPKIEKPAIEAKIDLAPPSDRPSMEYPLSQSEIMDFRQRLLQAKIRDRVNLIKKDPANTTNQEALQNYISWLIKVERENPETITISGTYPQDICARKLATTVVYGVYVNEIGKAIDLHLIKSSGYKIFDRQAEKEIMSQTFKHKIDKPTAYRVDLHFKPSDRVCPGLTVSS